MSATHTAERAKRSAKAIPKKAAPPKKATKPAPKVAETISLKSVFERMAESHDLTKKQGQSLLNEFVSLVTSALKGGDKVRLTGLGILEVKDQPARMGRNPRTGIVVQILAGKKIAFRAAKELKEAV
jgi:DNA-binding protein HU-beta